MLDHRESDENERTRTAVSPSESGGERALPAGVAPRRPSRVDAIEAVSHLLSLKKPAIDRLSAPSPTRLPKFPRSLQATALEWKKGPSLQAKFEASLTSIEPPPLSLPSGGTLSGQGRGESPPGESSGAESPGPSGVIPAALVGDALTLGGLPSVSVLEVPGSVGAGSGVAGPLPDRVRPDSPSWPIPVGMEAPGRPGDSGEAAGPMDVLPLDSGTGEIAATVRLAGSTGLDRQSPVGLPQAIQPSPGIEAPPRNPGDSGRDLALPASRAAASPIAVRTPLASGLRDLSGSSRDWPGQSSRPDESGPGADPVGPPLGGSTVAGGGGGVDLSKTNELLRQLLDAVKRQRDTSLPVGGPSVYPGR